MTPEHCRDTAASLLRRAGFDEPVQPHPGASRYLKGRGVPFKIRVSTHRRRNTSRFRYADVKVSIVFERPHTQGEVELRVSRAIELFEERVTQTVEGEPA